MDIRRIPRGNGHVKYYAGEVEFCDYRSSARDQRTECSLRSCKPMPNVTFILNAAFLAGNLMTTRAFCGGDSHAH